MNPASLVMLLAGATMPSLSAAWEPACGFSGTKCCRGVFAAECPHDKHTTCGDDNFCVPCGGKWQSGCDKPGVPVCNVGLGLNPETDECMPCGGKDAICCATEPACHSSSSDALVCTHAGLCKSCGGNHEPSCDDDMREPCDLGLEEDANRVCFQPGCGNGRLERGEQCEPPNTGACDATCTVIECPAVPECGNGVVEDGEACDPLNDDRCGSDCKPLPFCGDMTVQPGRGEQCEPPNTSGCDANCQHAIGPAPEEPFCGDGEVNVQGEQCDPPNGSTCDANCQTIDAPEDPNCKTCGETGKPVEVILEWACGGAPPTTVSGAGKKGGQLQYSDGVLRLGSVGGGKLGSQQDFEWSGPSGRGSEGIHVSCSAPFGLGVRTIGAGESKDCQGGCEGPACTGCFVVVDATSEDGDKFCTLDCAAGGKKGSKGKKSGKNGKMGGKKGKMGGKKGKMGGKMGGKKGKAGGKKGGKS